MGRAHPNDVFSRRFRRSSRFILCGIFIDGVRGMDTALPCLHNTMVINIINAIRVRTWHANVPTGECYHLAVRYHQQSGEAARLKPEGRSNRLQASAASLLADRNGGVPLAACRRYASLTPSTAVPTSRNPTNDYHPGRCNGLCADIRPSACLSYLFPNRAIKKHTDLNL